ncbi:Low-density receptor-like protein [Thalictrum thalictroides]|uniref:Low-density receptor-like protein n=1 Tax=Thalictrum thalictroides TaxID=46969 RepID=A0A7J6VE48_THATH|nr:Low-density receptor-like protein [Thalictrum thalictroides]
MSSSSTAIRTALIFLVILAAFYICRPLYWKLSATIQEIRENKTTFTQGISQFVHEARRSVGWINDESHTGPGVAISRRILRFVDSKQTR